MVQQDGGFGRLVDHTLIQSRVLHAQVSHMDMQYAFTGDVFQGVPVHMDLGAEPRDPVCYCQCLELPAVSQPLPRLPDAEVLHHIEGTALIQALALGPSILYLL